MNQRERLSGILLHPTSLPSPYGIGDLGSEAKRFVDFLKNAGQHLWQILPLTHTGYGDSPYQSFSAFAGQPLLISPEHLVSLGFLEEGELSDCPSSDPEHIDYGAVIPWKEKILALAYRRFRQRTEANQELKALFDSFREEECLWLPDYALFMACKKAHGGVSWLEWEDSYRRPTAQFKEELSRTLSEDIEYYEFIQFLFFQEWKARMCGRTSICSSLMRKASPLPSQECRQIISPLQDSSGATRCTTGTRTGRNATRGGCPGSGPSLRTWTFCGSTISAVLKHTGLSPTGRRPPRWAAGARDPAWTWWGR